MPTPDRDSASLRIVNLLSILEKMVDKLTFAVGDSPSWRTSDKWQLSIYPLQDTKINLLKGHDAIAEHLRQQGQIYDVVILSRLNAASRYIRAVRQYAPQAALVFDTTDLHFLRGYRGARVTSKVNLMKSALLAKKEELSIARQADCTLVVSPVEKEILEEECPGIQVHVISNIHTVYGSRQPLLRTKLPDVKITIIGSDPPVWLKQAKTGHFTVTDYVPDIASHFNHCRLSIAPLRYGAGVKGKVLLSMSYGVPVVASSIAAEGIPVVNGRDMLIADTPENFSNAMVELYINKALWSQMSQNGLEIIDQHFSFAVAWQALLNLFDNLGLKSRIEAILSKNSSGLEEL
jgi:hypothetical protein